MIALLLACTSVSLEPIEAPPPARDDRLALEGQVCTLSPQEVVYPSRVLFLIDASESMRVHDPVDDSGESGRERAVREVVEELLVAGSHAEVSVVRFSSEAQPLTPQYAADGSFEGYFSGDLEQVVAVLPALSVTDRSTNFHYALSEAYAELRDEMGRLEQSSLPLSSFDIVLVTDGLPEEGGGEDDILDAVHSLSDLAALYHVGELRLSTVFVPSGQAAVDAAAEELLREMAEEGGGRFRSVEGEIDLSGLAGGSLQRVFTLDSLVATNLNALPSGEQVLADSDGDGLSDLDEQELGTSVLLPDSDGDGCRDLVELYAGMDPLDGEDCDGGCYTQDFLDGDGDGLLDCEERFVGTHRSGSDSDVDGLPDFLELRAGTSPTQADESDDLDWDGVDNGEEVRSGTDPLQPNPSRLDQATRYEFVELPPDAEGRTCTDFRVENLILPELVPLATAEASSGPGGQGFSGNSRVLITAGEVPFDDREAPARQRVACVEARFVAEDNRRDPPSGLVELSDEDFVDMAAFEADTHCLRPSER